MAQARHCLTCSSGTTALDLIMRAWSFGPGDAVFTTPFSFFATAESIANTGATPVFVDIDPVTFNLNASYLERAIEKVAQRYDELLSSLPGVVCPTKPDDGLSAWAQHTVLLPDRFVRKSCIDAMKRDGIPTAVFYPRGMHEQEALAYLGYMPEDFPMVQEVSARVLSLPMYPYLTEVEQQIVGDSLRNALSV